MCVCVCVAVCFFDSLQTGRNNLWTSSCKAHQTMLSFSLSSVNDISSNITSRDYDDDEFLFSAKMRPLSNDKLIHRQSSSFVFVMSESSLRTLGYEEQIAFLVIFSIITSVSLFGNLLTICALIMR